MASISGAQTIAGVQIASTWGTAVQAAAGDRIAGEISWSANINELQSRQIGSGAYMLSNATRGSLIPTVNLTGDLGYRNGYDVLLAQMMGTSGAPSETTASQSDYKHTITFNTSLNAKYVTFAFESSSATVIEFPTCAVRSYSLRSQSVPGYIDCSVEMVANTVDLSTSTNTNANLASTTYTEGTAELAALAYEDTYQTNAQSGGSVSSGDQYNITSFDFSLTRPQDIVGEIKGAAGNSAPTSSGLLEGAFNITVKELADHALYTIWNAETTRKAKLSVEGSQIGSGVNKRFTIFMPRMILVQEPVYALSSPGTNTLSLNFRLLKASANPTGMSSTYPYFEIVNGLSTSLLA